MFAQIAHLSPVHVCGVEWEADNGAFVAPVSGCDAVPKHIMVVISSSIPVQNFDENLTSQSETMEPSTPWNLRIPRTFLLANNSIESVILAGRIRALHLKLSVITRIVS